MKPWPSCIILTINDCVLGYERNSPYELCFVGQCTNLREFIFPAWFWFSMTSTAPASIALVRALQCHETDPSMHLACRGECKMCCFMMSRHYVRSQQLRREQLAPIHAASVKTSVKEGHIVYKHAISKSRNLSVSYKSTSSAVRMSIPRTPPHNLQPPSRTDPQRPPRTRCYHTQG